MDKSAAEMNSIQNGYMRMCIYLLRLLRLLCNVNTYKTKEVFEHQLIYLYI